MSQWIEIQALRILALDDIDYRENYDAYSKDGTLVDHPSWPHRVIKKSTHQVFNLARFRPMHHDPDCGVYLEVAEVAQKEQSK